MRSRAEMDGPRIRTMGQAEERGYRLLALGAGMLGVGLLMSLTVVLLYLGIPLFVAGAMLVLGDIAWMYLISRRMTEHVSCPDCHKRNIVLPSVPSFVCDDCGQKIALQRVREAAP